MFQDLLLKIDRALSSGGFPYMIIGGQAVMLYGEPRLTRDVDVTLGAGTDRLGELLSVAAGMGLEALPDDPEAFAGKTMVLPCRDPSTGLRVDFILSLTPYEREAIGRAVLVDVGGGTVAFCTPEDLIIHKVFAGRPRDLEDAASVILRNPGLDLAYVRRWLKTFSDGGEKDHLAVFEVLLTDLPEAGM